MKNLNLTPEVFVEVFCLSLYFGWEPVNLLHTWSTVDHVLKTLAGLGVITEVQHGMVQHKKMGNLHQRRLYSKLSLVRADTMLGKRVEGDLTLTAQDVLSRRTPFAMVTSECSLPYTRLVRNARVHLTYAGASLARMYEEEYGELGLTRTVYKAEEARVAALFATPGAHAAAGLRYHREVERTVGDV